MSRLVPLVVILLACGCAAVPMGLRSNMLVDGNSISYVSSVERAPTVAFESGLATAVLFLSITHLKVAVHSGHVM